jgi:hypothetical protein
MKARSTLLMELATVIQKRGMTQAEAAELFGVTQPRISPPKPLLNVSDHLTTPFPAMSELEMLVSM